MKLQPKKNAPAAPSSAKPPSTASKNPRERWTIFCICVALAVMTFAVYGQTLGYDFVNYDDDQYVYDNPIVSAGLTFNGIGWAFGHYQLSNWVPLTMLSHMLDCQFYHLNAGDHHLINVLLHAASAIILFLVLWQMTRALWRSAFVAAIFAVHPLHVESVAWIAERKDTLSGFFFMLTLWAYARYVRNTYSVTNYLLIILFFALGLMSKSMLVTVPFILLLLDYWPLNRFSQSPDFEVAGWSKNLSTPSRLAIEKIPLFALSIACGLITVFAQGHAIRPLTEYSFPVRIENALISYVTYACQLFYPANLAVFYPFRANGFPLLQVAVAVVVLAAITSGVFVWRRKYPWLLVGWLWFLIMLLPVIGILQVGFQTRADRYTYLPEIGLSLLVVWLAVEQSVRLPNHRTIVGITSALALIALMASARTQASYWRNSESLWTRALAVTQSNSIAHDNLGLYLVKKGDLDGAASHFQSAIAINPSYFEAFLNLGNVFFYKNQFDEAIAYYQKALNIKPNSAQMEDNLGLAYAQKGEMDEAIIHFQKSVTIDPHYEDGRENLRIALAQKAQSVNSVAPAANAPAK